MTVPGVRRVAANRLVSLDLPPVVLTVDPAFTYVGGPCFTLYGIAHAEQHLFVVADAQGRVQRFVWVQFEGFLPDNDRIYRYPVTQLEELGGRPFIYDPGPLDVEAALAARPDSDLAAAHEFLVTHGYHLAGTMYGQRFVVMVSSDNRSELMIIYADRGDGPEDQAQGALARARASFTIDFRAEGS